MFKGTPPMPSHWLWFKNSRCAIFCVQSEVSDISARLHVKQANSPCMFVKPPEKGH